jgi:hypothetical protein
MHDTRPTLPQRVSAILRAKQYLVFFAIVLVALQSSTPVATSWLRRGGSFGEAYRASGSPFVDAVAERDLVILALALLALPVVTYLRAGYLRSIIGRFHPGPRDGRQFASLLGLEVIIGVLTAGTAALLEVNDRTPALDALALAAFFATLAVLLVIVYADYAIVVSGLGTLRALSRSFRTARLNPAPTLLIVLAMTTVTGVLAAGVAELITGSLLSALPVLVIRVLLTGIVTFVADVALIVVYLETLETGKIREHGRPD